MKEPESCKCPHLSKASSREPSAQVCIKFAEMSSQTYKEDLATLSHILTWPC